MGWSFALIFHSLTSQPLRSFFSRRVDCVVNVREWMKWHGTSSGSNLGMGMEHVGGVLPQFDYFLMIWPQSHHRCGTGAPVQNMLEMASNG